MKKIVCELCEGTEFTKDGGFFICRGCGTRYSPEEAKNMMHEVEGENESIPVPAVSAPVFNPNQQQIDNLLILATTAFEAQNYQETESYCNRVIELDAMSYKAWLLKGRAIAWSSSLTNNRIQEATHSFCNAIDFAPDEEKDDVKAQTLEELKKLGEACISIRKKNFISKRAAENYKGFQADKNIILESLSVLNQHGREVTVPESFFDGIADIMQEAVRGALNGTSPSDINGLKLTESMVKVLSKPEQKKTNLRKVQEEYEYCFGVLLDAIEISKNDVSNIQRCKELIPIGEKIISMEYITASEKATFTSVTNQVKDKQAALERKVVEEKEAAIARQNARIAAYWEAHADEKAALEAEKEQLMEKYDTFGKEIDNLTVEIEALKKEEKATVSSEDESDNLRNQIRDLEKRRANLGLFSGKEKKQITEEIASLQGRIDSLKGKIEEEKKEKAAGIKVRLDPLQSKKDELTAQRDAAEKRISAIEAEFTKDPE